MPFRILPRGLLLSALLFASVLTGCNTAPDKTSVKETEQTAAAHPLTPGLWRGVLKTQGQEFPFRFEVAEEEAKPIVYLINHGPEGEQRLRCDDITVAGDSATVKLHVSNAGLVLRRAGEAKLTGTWVKYDAPEPHRVPLEATLGEQQLPLADGTTKLQSFEGTWRVTFTDAAGRTYPAVGTFTQTGNGVTGAFQTSTGSYRYLAGQVEGTTMRLSSFDGTHAWLFTATRHSDTNTIINGDFYNSQSGHETWRARLDAHAKLPDASGPGMQQTSP